MKKILVSILFFYLLTLVQVSFFASFIPGVLPNLILISVIFFVFLENPTENFGFFIAFLGGFFIDIFSSHSFGLTIISLLFLTFLLKYLIASLKKLTVLWFLSLSFGALIVYNLFSSLQKGYPHFSLGMLLSLELIYNFIILFAVFYLFMFSKKYVRFFSKKNF